jgi:hypothetical protein
MSETVEMLRARIQARKDAAELISIALEPIKEKLGFIETKIAEYSQTYSYWLNYKTPSDGVCDRSIEAAHEQLQSMYVERKYVLASVGLYVSNSLRYEFG